MVVVPAGGREGGAGWHAETKIGDRCNEARVVRDLVTPCQTSVRQSEILGSWAYKLLTKRSLMSYAVPSPKPIKLR